MRIFKEIIIIFIIWFLLFSFGSVSFNINQWYEEARWVMICFFVISFALFRLLKLKP